jgi:uncharacterized membrane protein YesL
MADALQVIGAAFKDLWDDLWTAAVCNLLWLVANLLIVPGPPATAALFYYGNQVAHDEIAELRDFLAAFRRSWGLGWRWGLVNLLVIGILFGDALLTSRLSESTLGRFAQGFYLAVLIVWLLVQLYALPFFFEQETQSVRLALRNGALMLAKNPGFSLALAVLLLSALLAGTLLFMLSVAGGGAFLALVGNHAVLNRLRAQRSPG